MYGSSCSLVYQAPEVIRHESPSSNANVYSFGLCLWQQITREASMTPVQAAYAVAENNRPKIPASTPRRLQEIITPCWQQTPVLHIHCNGTCRLRSRQRNLVHLLQFANEMLANVDGNSHVNVDFTTPVSGANISSFTSVC